MSKYAVEPGSIARSLTMEARAIVAIPVTEKTHTHKITVYFWTRANGILCSSMLCFIVAVVAVAFKDFLKQRCCQ